MHANKSPWILMCRPDFFSVDYEINAWMDRRQQPDHGLALQQWHALHQIIKSTGAWVSMLPPEPNLPDLVFTANAALIYGHHAILSCFRPKQRRAETEHDAAWFAAHGFTSRRLADVADDLVSGFFEGAGDALFCGETLYAGYRMRSDAVAMQKLGSVLGCRVIPLELIDPYFYHLDTCFCPLTVDSAIYYSGAFDDYGRTVLKSHIANLIEVNEVEARAFACNAVVIEKQVVFNSGCPQLSAQLRTLGYDPIETPLTEFVKSGGAAKCLTLRLDGEQAASWRKTSTESVVG